ncbi:MAG: DUF885 domain-containing protein [Candidatus Edwardsbacteria bacterium]|nr:DUF885 domain-containing protein [Candidatus Edwardsbacteria bacterium]
MRSTIFSTVLVLIITGTVFCAKPKEKAPSDIEDLFRGYFRESMELSPETASSLGLTPAMGYPINNDKLDDDSEEALERAYAMNRKYRKWLKSYDPKKLTPSQRMDAEILAWQLDRILDGYQFRYHSYVVTPMQGVHATLVTLMTEYHGISSRQDVLDYLARLEKIEKRLDQSADRMKLQFQKGIYPTAAIFQHIGQMMSEFVAVPPDSNLYYISLSDRIGLLKDISKTEKAEMLEKAKNTVAESIYPAYRRYLSQMEVLGAKAGQEPGVWKLPDGDKYYRYCLRKHTSTKLSPEEIHQLGLKEVARIQAEAKILLNSLGIKDKPTFGEMMNDYRQMVNSPENKDKFTYPSTPNGKRQVINDYQAIIDKTWERLPALFSLMPKTKVSAQPVPQFKEASGSTYYEPGSLDGRRQGTFYVNQGWLPLKPNMATLAYHEAIPGHHFQIALQQEMPDNRIFKALFFIPGFGEGWALYSERLAKEQGWLPDAYSRLGYLNSELFRAVRLVVDTGIHQKRWTLQQAAGYMQDNLGWAGYGELGRYSVWPGQACSYKVGELKIVEMRERTKAKLGGKFDIKEFHRMVLQQGSIPLEMLEKLTEDFIRRNS